MTLSLSSSVCPSVMKEFFFSLRSYKGVSRKSNGCFNEVSRMFHASFMDRKFQGSFKKVSRVLQGCFERVLREFLSVFQRSAKDDSRKFLSCFDEVSMVFLESVKCVAKSFWYGILRGVLKAFQGVVKKLSSVFQECF